MPHVYIYVVRLNLLLGHVGSFWQAELPCSFQWLDRGWARETCLSSRPKLTWHQLEMSRTQHQHAASAYNKYDMSYSNIDQLWSQSYCLPMMIWVLVFPSIMLVFHTWLKFCLSEPIGVSPIPVVRTAKLFFLSWNLQIQTVQNINCTKQTPTNFVDLASIYFSLTFTPSETEHSKGQTWLT